MLAYFYEKFPASLSAIRSDLTSERVDQFVDNYINKDKKRLSTSHTYCGQIFPRY